MISRIGLRWRMFGLLVAVVVIVALPYMVNRSSSEAALNTRDWVTHTADIKANVYRFDAIIRSSEAAIYALVGGAPQDATLTDRALYPRNTLPPLIASLREMMGDNPEQLTRLGALESTANGRM